ncbi:monocarboxylate transporter 9-like [Uloborus diversus]|uniref:monocarboxylate transporter 9-like n=1 Tax=Uloborus diversus TaxID=327109 RepID=UPI00240A335A|nr:monocarboxylate transporter 9-like [Uloborus diversus]XP_054721681.1 monocarboxylate transporter 9-like [Uloborus diversus]
MPTKTKDGPDTGWSWVVAFAACFNSLILAGIFRTGGVLFVAFINNFGVTREEASWPMVLCISVLNLTGPFAGILGQKYGVRPITIIGAVIGTIGISGCFFTTSLSVINILFGIVFGIGYGLVNTLMPVIVNIYFLNLRATANGIANSGSCFGSLILPVFFEYLIASYGLTGCFLLTGGVVLHVAVAGALLRPPYWLEKSKVKSDVEDIRCSNEQTNEASNIQKYGGLVNSSLTQPTKPNSSFFSEDETEQKLLTHEINDVGNGLLDPNSKKQQELLSELNLTLRHRSSNQKILKNGLSETKSLNHLECSHSEKSKDFLEEKVRSEDALLQSISDFENVLKSFSQTSLDVSPTNERNTNPEINSQKYEDASNHSGEVRQQGSNLYSSQGRNTKRSSSDSSNSIEEENEFQRDESENLLSDSSLLTSGENNPYAKEEIVNIRKSSELSAKTEPQKLMNRFLKSDNNKTCLDSIQSFKIVLSNPLFYITAITNVSFYFLFHMYVVIIIDYGLDIGIPESETKYILFAFAISDLFGRLSLGWVTDRKYLRRSHFVMLGMAAIGVVFFCFPFARTYQALIVASCCYGLLLGCTMIVFPILLVDFLGTETHAVAYGCMCFMNGFASFGRPFLIGYFRDSLGSYANIFYICGLISLAASLFWLFERCLIKEEPKEVGGSAV